MKSSDGLHVLIIPSWYPEGVNISGGSFFREQAIGLASIVAKVGVLVPRLLPISRVFHGNFPPLGIRESQDSGTLLCEKISFNLTPRIRRGFELQWIHHGKQLYEWYAKKHGKPNVIHAHCALNAGLLAQTLAKIHHIPYVITEHSSEYDRNLLSHRQLDLASSAFEMARARIAVSSSLQNSLEKRFALNFQNFPNVVDDTFFEIELKSEQRDACLNFINISNLIQIKRQDLLIEAMYICKTRGYKNFRLTLAGDGPEKKNLLELIKRRKLQNEIKLIGQIARAEVAKLLVAHDCYVLSSDYETFGVSLAEAMAMGLACISTQCGGPIDILKGTQGQLVKKNSPEEIANAMILLDKKTHGLDERLVQRRLCSARFSANSVCQLLEELYQELSPPQQKELSVLQGYQ